MDILSKSGRRITSAPQHPALQRTAAALALACALMLVPAPMARAGTASAETLEYRVKAAFLINFAKFIEWPDRAFSGPLAPIVFVIAGDDPFGDAFAPFQGQTIGSRPIVIQHIRPGEEVPPCHVLFIPLAAAQGQTREALVRKLQNAPILTVTEGDRQAAEGGAGIIHLFTQDERVAFAINNVQARKSGLVIRAKLLNLAAQVIH